MVFLKKEICDRCGKETYSSQLDFRFYHEWDSFIFWKPYNWRNFTVIHLSFETNNYSKYLEFDFAILGLHFGFDIYRKFYEIKCKDCFKEYLESITMGVNDEVSK